MTRRTLALFLVGVPVLFIAYWLWLSSLAVVTVWYRIKT